MDNILLCERWMHSVGHRWYGLSQPHGVFCFCLGVDFLRPLALDAGEGTTLWALSLLSLRLCVVWWLQRWLGSTGSISRRRRGRWRYLNHGWWIQAEETEYLDSGANLKISEELGSEVRVKCILLSLKLYKWLEFSGEHILLSMMKSLLGKGDSDAHCLGTVVNLVLGNV